MIQPSVCPFTYVSVFLCSNRPICGPGSSVGIATELRAGRSGIESRWGRGYPPVQTGPPSLLYNGYRVFPGGSVRSGRAADNSPPSSAAVMEEWRFTFTFNKPIYK